MKITLTQNEIAHELNNDKNNGFTWQGCLALAEYLDENCPEDEEFDRVAIRCEFSEYSSATEAAQEYGWEPEAELCDDDDNLRDIDEVAEENESLALDWLNNRTLVIEFDSGVIIQDF